MMKEPGRDQATWTVYRQDDNGNRFIVQNGLSCEEADRLVAAFEARGHKQLYWVEFEQGEPGAGNQR
jgi:hypothetical protein